MPGLLEDRGGAQVRAAVVAHLGELLGLIVVERRADDPPFTDDDDRVLAELARQVGLALHNVRLDSALQESLEQLEIRNQELAAISGIIIVGALIAAGAARDDALSVVLGTTAVALATINVVGGYLVTDRMLAMFKKKEQKERKRNSPSRSFTSTQHSISSSD
jgi:hypothetical protein